MRVDRLIGGRCCDVDVVLALSDDVKAEILDVLGKLRLELVAD